MASQIYLQHARHTDGPLDVKTALQMDWQPQQTDCSKTNLQSSRCLTPAQNKTAYAYTWFKSPHLKKTSYT